jgi:hypothetical protein
MAIRAASPPLRSLCPPSGPLAASSRPRPARLGASAGRRGRPARTAALSALMAAAPLACPPTRPGTWPWPIAATPQPCGALPLFLSRAPSRPGRGASCPVRPAQSLRQRGIWPKAGLRPGQTRPAMRWTRALACHPVRPLRQASPPPLSRGDPAAGDRVAACGGHGQAHAHGTWRRAADRDLRGPAYPGPPRAARHVAPGQGKPPGGLWGAEGCCARLPSVW